MYTYVALFVTAAHKALYFILVFVYLHVVVFIVAKMRAALLLCWVKN